MERLKIHDSLLRAALTGIVEQSDNKLIDLLAKQNWTHHSHLLGSIYLTYLVRKLFNIQRFPCFGDARMALFPPAGSFTSLREEAACFFQKISEKDVQNSLNELRRLYQVTQNWCNSPEACERFHISEGKIKLYRGFRHSEDIARLYYFYHKAKKEDKKEFAIYTNTLVSFSHRNGWSYVDIDNPVSIYPAIELKNILLTGVLIEDMEYDEWIVVNPHPRGEMKIQVEDVIFAKGENIFCGEPFKEYFERTKKFWCKKIEENPYKSLYFDNKKYPPHKIGSLVKIAFWLEQKWKKIREHIF